MAEPFLLDGYGLLASAEQEGDGRLRRDTFETGGHGLLPSEGVHSRHHRKRGQGTGNT